MTDLGVRIFQYSHIQRGHKKQVTIRYSVVSIETKDELPTFSLTYAPTKKEEDSNLLAEEVEMRLHEEIADASNVPFLISNGKTLNLSIARKFEIEALQIFSQELVEAFVKDWPTFILIGERKNLFAISRKIITTPAMLSQCDDLAHFLVDNIAVRIELIGRSVEAMKEALNKEAVVESKE